MLEFIKLEKLMKKNNRILLKKSKPICLTDYTAGENDKNDQEDDTASTACTRNAFAETKAILQPVEQPIEKE